MKNRGELAASIASMTLGTQLTVAMVRQSLFPVTLSSLQIQLLVLLLLLFIFQIVQDTLTI